MTITSYAIVWADADDDGDVIRSLVGFEPTEAEAKADFFRRWEDLYLPDDVPHTFEVYELRSTFCMMRKTAIVEVEVH